MDRLLHISADGMSLRPKIEYTKGGPDGTSRVYTDCVALEYLLRIFRDITWGSISKTEADVSEERKDDTVHVLNTLSRAKEESMVKGEEMDISKCSREEDDMMEEVRLRREEIKQCAARHLLLFLCDQ